jgi:UDP-N-acetylmuramoylalanine--D-glutamate ligase
MGGAQNNCAFLDYCRNISPGWPYHTEIKVKTLSWEGKKVTIVGLARTGFSVAKLLLAKGAKVTITDTEVEEKLRRYIDQLPPEVDLRLGGHPPEVFINTDTIVASPGVPLNIPPIQKAKQAGVKVISEIELAYRLTEIPIIAITGTNGKTTVTTLIGKLLEEGGKKIFVGGNIGNPLADEVLSSVRKDFWVAETSSFQLEAISLFRPSIGVLLNITPDHMDRYESFEEYVRAKARLFINQTAKDCAVVNADDEVIAGIIPQIKARQVLFSRTKQLNEGVMLKDGRIISRFKGKETMLCPADEVLLQGVHNMENVLAAVAVASLCGVKPNSIREVLGRFKGLEHRLELVAEINGIKFINDSKATNVGAVVKALEGFDVPLVLIAGGKDKGSDFSPLADIIKRKVSRLILIGKAKDKLKQAVTGFELVETAESLEAAVERGYMCAKPGWVVLLSPACASFDMFENFEQRGEVFKAAVRKLKAKFQEGDNN